MRTGSPSLIPVSSPAVGILQNLTKNRATRKHPSPSLRTPRRWVRLTVLLKVLLLIENEERRHEEFASLRCYERNGVKWFIHYHVNI